MNSRSELTSVPKTTYITTLVMSPSIKPNGLKDCFKALINKTLSKILDERDFDISEELNKDNELEIKVMVRK